MNKVITYICNIIKLGKDREKNIQSSNIVTQKDYLKSFILPGNDIEDTVFYFSEVLRSIDNGTNLPIIKHYKSSYLKFCLESNVDEEEYLMILIRSIKNIRKRLSTNKIQEHNLDLLIKNIVLVESFIVYLNTDVG